jgi:uncharacterized protein DUF3631
MLAGLREGRCEILEQLARKCARWADDNTEALCDADPDMGELLNRDADNWRGLFAIADLIGADWAERVREAAAILTPRESESTGPMLLADIKATFEAKKTDRLWSENLCEELAAMENRPWAEWKANKRAVPKPLSKAQLARLLDPFHVTPDSVWIADPEHPAGGRTKKGYLVGQFREAFERYLSPEGVSETEGRKEPNAAGTSGDSRNGREESAFRFENSEKPNNDGLPSGLPPCAGGEGTHGINSTPHPLVCEHCGNPERLPQKPVETFALDGQTYRMHPTCRREWLNGQNPNAWSFNAEYENDAPQIPLRTIGPAPPDSRCLYCHRDGSAGPVMRIRRGDRAGSRCETLHEGCARIWFEAMP